MSQQAVFNILQPIVLGQKKKFSVVGNPSEPILVSSLAISTPCPHFFILHRISLAEREYVLRMTDHPQSFDLPSENVDPCIMWDHARRVYIHPAITLTPDDTVTFEGEYSGLVPPGFKKDFNVNLALSLKS